MDNTFRSQVTQLFIDFLKGKKAFREGFPIDDTKSNEWKTGWRDAERELIKKQRKL